MLKSRHSQKHCRKLLASDLSPPKRTTQCDHKIRLMDLCPEEKAKIGQLMQLVDRERQANKQQANAIKNHEQSILLLKERIQELTTELTRKDEEIANLSDRLGKMSETITAKDVEMEELTNLYDRYVNREKQTTSAQCIEAQTYTIGIQTEDKVRVKSKPKRNSELIDPEKVPAKKHRNIKIQTEEDEQLVPNRKHSKSFERIMRSIGVAVATENYASGKPRKDRIKRFEEAGRNIRTFEPDTQNREVRSRDSDYQTAEMVRAWEVLKQQRLPSGKTPQQKSKRKRVDFETSQEQMVSTSKLSDLEYSEKETSPTKLLEVYNQLLSKTKERQNDYDDQELNRMLKSGKFEAKKAAQYMRLLDGPRSKPTKLDYYGPNLLEVVGTTEK